MHDLKPVTALGGHAPRIDTFEHVVIAEIDDVALASVAARLGAEPQCQASLSEILGPVPGPGHSTKTGAMIGFWTGPDQWMISAPGGAHAALADDLKLRLGATASVTEQSGGWACFDLTGSGIADVSERICAVPIRKMKVGDAQRSVIHQLGCFVIRMAEDQLRILGPRASAATLHHALITAAHSTS